MASVLRGDGLAALVRAVHIGFSRFGTKRQDPCRIQECPVAVVQLTEKEKVTQTLKNMEKDVPPLTLIYEQCVSEGASKFPSQRGCSACASSPGCRDPRCTAAKPKYPPEKKIIVMGMVSDGSIY